MLEVRHLSLRFADQVLLEDINFRLLAGELLLVDGPSGSGKTSLLEAVMGLQTADLEGEIRFAERSVLSLRPAQRASLGMVFLPETAPLFPELSVRQHLRLFPNPEALVSLFEDFPFLQTRQKQMAGTLSGGEKAILSAVMALLRQPQLLLWDMPLKGLSPDWINKIFRIIRIFQLQSVGIILTVQHTDPWTAFRPQLLSLAKP